MQHENIIEQTRHRKRSDSAGNRRVRSDLVFDGVDIHVADRFSVDMAVTYIHDDLWLIIADKWIVDQMDFSRGGNDIVWTFCYRFDLLDRSAWIARIDSCASLDAFEDERFADDIALSQDSDSLSGKIIKLVFFKDV